MSTSTVRGSCLCGAVRFEADLPTQWVAHCHCTFCRRAHGSPVVTWAGFQSKGFRLLSNSARPTWYESSPVVVVPDTDLGGAHLLAERIRMLVPSIDLLRWLEVRRITVGIGVTASTAADTVSTLLRLADAVLYTAKHAGRNCVRTDLAADVEVPTVWCETSTATL
jgi:hypothetical protein